MPFTVTVHHGLPYLLVEAAGPASLADLCGAADLTAAVASRRGYRRAVLDLRASEPDLTFTEHLQLGTHVAERMAPLERVASLVTEANRKGSSEKATQKLGLRLRAFLDRDEALAWICEP